MHGLNYQHNDIKPSNIGWSKEQQWYVLIMCQFLIRLVYLNSEKYFASGGFFSILTSSSKAKMVKDISTISWARITSWHQRQSMANFEAQNQTFSHSDHACWTCARIFTVCL